MARLDSALAAPLTVVVAPAGAGKTSSVAAWCAARPDRSVTWVANGSGLDGRRVADLLDDEGTEFLVVDDAHLMPTPALRALEDWLERDAPGPAVVLLCRWDPPLSRLLPMLRGQLTVIRGGALCLSDAESRALVEVHAPGLDPDVVDAICQAAHGWAAVIALAARAVAGSQDPGSVVRRLADRGMAVADLIASQVFATLGDRTRHLLLCVADEPDLTAAEAERLTGDLSAGDLLAELADSGLLVSRLAEGPGGAAWFRVHPLLAEVTRRRTRAGGVAVAQARSTMRKAALADMAAGRVARGLRRLVAAEAWADAVTVMADQGDRLLLQVPSELLLAVVAAEPELVAASPGACVTMALDRWIHADITTSMDWMRRMAAHPDSAGRPAEVALAALLRARSSGEIPSTAVEAARAFVDQAGFTTESPVVTGWLLTELGSAENWLGDLGQAEAHLRWAAAVAEPISRRLHAGALSHLAQTEYLLGRHTHAATLAGRAVEVVTGTGIAPTGAVAGVLSRARVVQGLTGATTGDRTEELDAQISSGGGVSALSDPMSTVLREIWTARGLQEGGDLEGATSWLDMSHLLPPMPAFVRVLVLTERAVLAALAGDCATLDRLGGELVEQGAATEAAIIEAARSAARGQPDQAGVQLAPAAAGDLPHVLGESPLVALVFKAQLVHPGGAGDLDWSVQGTPARLILARAGGATRWIRLLVELSAAGRPVPPRQRDPSAGAPDDVPLHVPRLTRREHEVLAELARGSTYADIAETLFVSENTVKTHVSAVYAKVGASRRSEALKTARSLGLV